MLFIEKWGCSEETNDQRMECEAMQNIIDYVEKEMNRLTVKAFSPVDSLVLSQFSYIRLNFLVPGILENAEPVRVRDLLQAEHFHRMFHHVRDSENNKKLLFAMAASPRFRDLKVSFYKDVLDNAAEQQFAAVTFFLDGDTAYIAFRGTDDTFTGWKEDFNMAYISPVPSQEDALRYLEAVEASFPGKLITGGHSKGGNLAVYAAMKCAPAVQNRILQVYSHDGPGFKDNIFESEEFKRISSRIHKTIPQSSLIGMLLEHQENYFVVESNRFGLMQHDPFSWSVIGDHFNVLKHLKSGSQYRNRTLSDWISEMSTEKREQFVDALFAVLASSKASTFTEFGAEWQKSIPTMLVAAKNLDAETKAILSQTIKELAVIALKNISRRHISADKTKSN